MRAVRRAVLEEAEIPRWGKDNRADRQSAINRAPTSNPAVSPESSELEMDETEDEIVGAEHSAQFIAPSEGDESSVFPQDNPWLTVTEEESGTKPPLLSRLWQSHVRGHDDLETDAANLAPARGATTFPDNSSKDRDVVAPLAGARPNADARHDAGATPDTNTNFADIQPNTSIISNEPAASAKVSRLPSLRVVGQLSQSYIVTEGPDGMYLIDQHAAHERILLERMVAALQARSPLSQLLLTPIKLELAPAELGAIEDHLQQLEYIGFTMEILEDNTLQVRAVPNVLVKQMNARSLQELLVEMTAPETPGHSETWEEHALANVACKAAIKANYFLTVSEMREMIEQLERTNAPYSCCHGRPTMIHFSLSALEREFGRR